MVLRKEFMKFLIVCFCSLRSQPDRLGAGDGTNSAGQVRDASGAGIAREQT
jgi:hypothetical protein